MFAFFFKRNHTFDTEKRGCVKTLAQPLLYFTVLLYFLLAMLDQRKNLRAFVFTHSSLSSHRLGLIAN